MNILFLSNAYPDFDVSYHGIFIKKMALLLIKEGYRIFVVTPKIYKKSLWVEEHQGITIYRFPFFSKNKRLIEYEAIPYWRMLIYYLSGFLCTLYVMLKHRCCLIHTHWAIPTGLIGVFTGAIFKKPMIVTIHGSDLRMATTRSPLIKKLFIYVCQKAKYLTCVSEVQEGMLVKMGIQKEKISTFPMGIDETFIEASRNRKFDWSDRTFIIVSNRNLLPIYNISLLIRSIPVILQEEPKTRFLIAGDGSEREGLKKEAENLKVGLSVKFLGQIPHDQMANFLSEADIYISTSLYDGTSVSLLEAMASGVFPIVTDIPSNREWIKDGENGFLVPTQDESILANKIIKAIRHPEFLIKACVENRKTILQRAHWDNQIKKIKDLYEHSLNAI